ncbi:hypothetical protein KQX54_014989 [Cotesia glomerata]|uniref:Uncharacterized protein n=1 Tax=Cotesia glomerata TaxID=32391 RepID=A0AAV7IWX3_COTGL|nr:hypothetical protein KQX54_014989 [Cotesia glomerata]
MKTTSSFRVRFTSTAFPAWFVSFLRVSIERSSDEEIQFAKRHCVGQSLPADGGTAACRSCLREMLSSFLLLFLSCIPDCATLLQPNTTSARYNSTTFSVPPRLSHSLTSSSAPGSRTTPFLNFPLQSLPTSLSIPS